ncbi:MAG: DUF6178 family protein [Candidatus Omnitrophica bacterium]|nr:DUF6178 family protein [Candidatus Omnitrophota bacterium]
MLVFRLCFEYNIGLMGRTDNFEELSLEEQVRIFRESPLKDKRDLILRCHDPDRITHSLSHEELYLITREMDLEERSEVIRHATLPQLLFISDLECWKKDRIRANGFLNWLETLSAADDRQCLNWLLESDYEMVVAGLKELIHVLKREWEFPPDEALGDMPYFSLDEFYFVYVKEENLETVKRALEILFENHRGRYAALMEGVISEMDYEVEEEAYRKREKRLEDLGFPDPETARRVYRPITEEEFENYPRKEYHAFDADLREAARAKLPDYLVLWSDQKMYLDDVLLLLREEPMEVRQSLEDELVWLSNKVIACDGVDFAAEEKIHRGAKRTRALVSLGLQCASGNDLVKASRYLKERWIETIFRLAISRLVEIRGDAEELVTKYWKGAARDFLEFLVPPYELIFKGLLRTVPECYDHRIDIAEGQLRDFRDVEDLGKTQKAVMQIRQIHEFLNDQCPRIFDRGAKRQKRDQARAHSLLSILGEIFASYVLKGTTNVGMISQAEAVQFLEKAFKREGNVRVLTAESKENFFDKFFSKSDMELLRPLWGLVFQAFEDEFGRLDVSEGIDPRFISVLNIQAKKLKKE